MAQFVVLLTAQGAGFNVSEGQVLDLSAAQLARLTAAGVATIPFDAAMQPVLDAVAGQRGGNPPYAGAVTDALLAAGLFPLAPGGTKSFQTFGSSQVSNTTTPRYLPPGWEAGTAPTFVVEFVMPFAGTFTSMRAHHSDPGTAATQLLTYTLHRNGVATALFASLLSTASDGSGSASVPVIAGDRVSVVVTKSENGNPPEEVSATLAFEAST